MGDKELEEQNQAAEAVEEANGQEEQAPAGAQPLQPMQNEGENEQAPAAENADDQAAQVDAQVDAAADDAANQAQGEDPQEANEEAEEGEQGEQGGDPQNEQPQNMDAKAQEANLANDEVNQDIANMAAEVGIENEEEEDQGDPDRAFDTLDDLKKLNGEGDNADEEGDDQDTGEQVIKNRKAVKQLRKGNLYKAVIFTKMLENGQNPAGEEQELEARQPAGGGGRFNRFLNSSKLDKAGKVMKLANAGSGLLGMASSTYKNSGISKLIGKANDVIVLVNSIRGIIKKLRDFKKNSTSKTKKAFAVIGLIQDFGMAISKGASLAQGIAQRRGWSVLGTALGYLSSFANIAGQMATLINVSNTLKEAVQSLLPIKKAQKEEEANVKAVLQKYEAADAAGDAAEEEDPEEEEEEAEEAEQGQGENKKAEKGKGKKEKKAKKPQKPKKAKESRLRSKRKKALKAKVLNALERPDVSKEDKAVLASYLGRERIISKKKFAIANVATGLITAALGFGGSISKSVAANTEGGHSERAATSASAFGGLANASILLSAAGTHIAGKKVNRGPGEQEGNLIKEGLYGALHNLASDDKYGLRKIAATLEPKNPDGGHLQEAEYAVKAYETASKQLSGSGVNYAQLFKATDTETFKNSLVASL